jgi:hypothetical protein
MDIALIVTTWLLASSSPTSIPTGINVEPQLRSQIVKKAATNIFIACAPEMSPQEVEEMERRNREDLQRQQPTKPLDVKAQRVGIHSVNITWKPPVVNQIDGQPIVGYEVWRQEGDKVHFEESLGTTTNLFFLDNTAERGKSYVYSAQARTKNSFGLLSPAVPVQIP